MISRRRTFFVAPGIVFLALGCSRAAETPPTEVKRAGPPEPTVTHAAADAKQGKRIDVLDHVPFNTPRVKASVERTRAGAA